MFGLDKSVDHSQLSMDIRVLNESIRSNVSNNDDDYFDSVNPKIRPQKASINFDDKDLSYKERVIFGNILCIGINIT
jgi:hypothetical protein